MSFGYVVASINQQFERLAGWYQEFMHRAEQSFRALHDRITYLEDRQAWQGPSDEQVERVLRKILAERFADAGVQRVENPNVMKDGAYFVKNPKDDAMVPKAIAIDVASLAVDPSAVPSKKYGETLQMLDGGISGFPHVDLRGPARNDHDQDSKDSAVEFKLPKSPANNRQHRKPWS